MIGWWRRLVPGWDPVGWSQESKTPVRSHPLYRVHPIVEINLKPKHQFDATDRPRDSHEHGDWIQTELKGGQDCIPTCPARYADPGHSQGIRTSLGRVDSIVEIVSDGEGIEGIRGV